MSELTARTHASAILNKLGLAPRTQAGLLAVREGMSSSPGRPTRSGRSSPQP